MHETNEYLLQLMNINEVSGCFSHIILTCRCLVIWKVACELSVQSKN